MYLAGMVADGSQMSKKQLNGWAEGAVNLQMISEYTVPWVTVENADALGGDTERCYVPISDLNRQALSGGPCGPCAFDFLQLAGADVV
jgi:hypothetical protein